MSDDTLRADGERVRVPRDTPFTDWTVLTVDDADGNRWWFHVPSAALAASAPDEGRGPQTPDRCSECGVPFAAHPLTDACAIAQETRDREAFLAASAPDEGPRDEFSERWCPNGCGTVLAPNTDHYDGQDGYVCRPASPEALDVERLREAIHLDRCVDPRKHTEEVHKHGDEHTRQDAVRMIRIMERYAALRSKSGEATE